MSAIKRRRMNAERSYFRWGLVSLLVLIPALYLGFTKSIPFKPHYEVQAVFSSAATQVKSGSPVRIAGVNVGKVSKVERGAGTTALVTMRINDKGRPLSTDSTAKIRPRLFLEGNFFVDLKPGVSGVELEDDDTIPITQTAIPVQFDEMLRTYNKSGRADLQTTFKEFATSLSEGGATGLNQSFDNAPQGLDGLARTMAAFRGIDPNDLSRFISNTAVVSGALTEDTAALAGLVRGLDGTLDALGSRAEPFADSMDLAAELFQDFPPLQQAAVGLVGPATQLADALGPALDAMPGALRPTNELLRDAQPLLRDDQLPLLARTLRPALADLSDLTPGLRRAFTQIDPVAQCVRDNLVPILNGHIEDGPLTTDMKVWEELVRFPVGLAGASGNFNGNGHGVRLNAGGNEQLLAIQPSLGDIISVGENPLVGARPTYRPGIEPPFRPSTDCRTQPVPSLDADTTAAPAARTLPPLSAAEKARKVAQAHRILARVPAKGSRLMLRTLKANIRYLAAILGLFLIAAGVSAFILINERLPVPWDDRYDVKAEFLTAQAITPGQGQTVTVSGVKVGDVAKVELDEGRAVVTMSIERDKLASVGENARLLLRPKTPLQDMSIDMDPGPPDEQSIGSRVLPVSQTQANVNVDEVLAALDGDTRNYLSIMLSSFGRGLGDNGVNLRRLFAATSPTAAQLAELDTTLEGRHEDLKELVGHLRGVTQSLASEKDSLIKLVQAGNVAFGTIDTEQESLKQSLDLLPGTLARANRVLDTLTPFTNQLRQTATDLVPVVRHTGPALRKLTPLVEAAQPAVQSLRELTPAAIPLASDLRTALREIKPTVPKIEQIARVGHYALNELSFVPDAPDRSYLFWLAWFGHNANSMLSGSDANGAFWRAIAVASCSSVDPIPGSLALLTPLLSATRACALTP